MRLRLFEILGILVKLCRAELYVMTDDNGFQVNEC